MMIVYETTNLINGKRYIGQDSKNDPTYLGSGVALKRAIEKYGKENFQKIVLEYCFNVEELNEKEQYWIDKRDAVNNSAYYNLKEGGSTGKHSETTKRKISKNNGKYWLGKELYENTKKKMSEAHRGKTIDKAHRKNLSKALTGRKLTKKHKENISKSCKGRIPWNKGMRGSRGSSLSEDHRKKISASMKLAWKSGKRKITDEARRKMSEAGKRGNEIKKL